jgi:hypothetical protein
MKNQETANYIFRRAFMRANATDTNAPAPPTSASITVGSSGESSHPV